MISLPPIATLIHSSDIHIGSEGPGSTEGLDKVLGAARFHQAQVLLLAGDVFDHNRVSLRVLDEVVRKLGDAPFDVVILPGNHDCLTADSVYRKGGLAEPTNVHILGIEAEQVVFPGLDLTIWGRPHRDYFDMKPMDGAPARTMGRQVVTAHGFWHGDTAAPNRSWLISNEELAALEADYVALGHFDVHSMFMSGETLVSYSGSPDLARSVNRVVFTDSGTPTVTREPLPLLNPATGLPLFDAATGEAL